MSKNSVAKPSKAKPIAKKGAVSKSAPPKAVKTTAKPAAVKPYAAKPAAAKKPAVTAKPAAGKVPPSKATPKSVAKPMLAKDTPKPAPARTIATTKPAAPKKTEGVPKKMSVLKKVADVVLPPNYRPSDSEPFMNEMHRAYFRKRLIEWKDDILRQTRETLAILHEDSTQHADLADRATSETDRATELRTRDRQRKLIAKIDAALGRIEDGSYGYCEDTGEPIGLKRLDARPIATLSVEAQERHERREKVYREE